MRLSGSILICGGVLATAGCAGAPLAAPAAQPAAGPQAALSSGSGATAPPLFLVDGVRQAAALAQALPPGEIASVSVLKGAAATERFGPDAANGVVMIETRGHAGGSTTPATGAGRVTAGSTRTEPPLYIINGQIATAERAQVLDPSTISQVEVLKGSGAVERYGSAAAHGVVVITLKQAAGAVR